MKQPENERMKPTHAAITIANFEAVMATINQHVPTGIGRKLLEALETAVPIRLNPAPTDADQAPLPPEAESV